MKNVTVTLDPRTAAWVRVYAAQHGISVSRLIGQVLQERMREEQEYANAMRRFLAKAPQRLKRKGERYSPRAELHDRAGLR